MRLTDKVWIIAILIVSLIHFATLICNAPLYTEADIESAWSAGYKECHIDKNLPQPDHKTNNPNLKRKING